MIDLYTWSTPNGRKVSIMLEEVSLPYRAVPINITADEQFDPGFLAIAPNNKIPAVFDQDTGVRMMESGAILFYLAEKTGRLLPATGAARYTVTEWLMWQMGGPGPMLGQLHHFARFNPGKAPYAEERFGREAHRLYGVMDRRLADRAYLAGDYSIADIATWPWITHFAWQGVDLADYPNVKRWYEAVAARPAVQRGYHVPIRGDDVPMP